MTSLATTLRSATRGSARTLRAATASLALALVALNASTVKAGDDAPHDDSGSCMLIVSPNVEVTGISAADVGRLLLGQRRYWRSGQQVVLLLPASGSPARRYLLDRVFRMTEADYRRHTLGQLYRGELDYAPKAVLSDGEALQYVTSGHGAIAVVPANVGLPTDTHVLRIDGRLPGDPGYLLSH